MYFLDIKDPAINCNRIARPDSVSVVATGVGFGATQAHPLVISTAFQTSGGATVATQTVTSWSDTSITFDVNLGAIDPSDALYLIVDTGDTYPPSTSIAVSHPDVRCASGSFAASTATGSNVAVSGLSFKPKTIFLWTSAASGASQISGQGVGFAASSVVVYAAASRADAASYTTKGTRSAGGNFAYAYNATIRYASITATSDGFSISFSSTDAQSRIIHWIAFGGRTMSYFRNGAAVSAGSLPFGSAKLTPDLVLVSHIANTNTTSTDGPMFGLGAIARNVSSDIKQWSVGWSAFSADSSSSYVHSKISTNAFAEQIYNGAATWSAQATSLGYANIAWSGSDSDSLSHLALFLDGAEIDIGTVTKGASASTTELGSLDDPDLMIIAAGGGAKDTVVGHVNMAFGVATASHQSHARTWADLVSTATQGDQASDTTKAIGAYDSSGSVVDVGSISLSGTPTITWVDPRAGTSEIAYVAIKLPAAAPEEQDAYPDHLAASSTLYTPTASPSGNGITSPDSISATSTLYTPSATGTGTGTASPDSLVASPTIYAPTASGSGSVGASAGTIAASSILSAPTAAASGSATVSPATIAADSTLYSPSASASGSATASPDSLSANTTIFAPAATGTGEGTASPDSIIATANLESPTATGSGPATASASSVTASATIDTPAASGTGTATASPTSITASSTLYAPTAGGDDSIAHPGSITATSTPYAPTASATGAAVASASHIDASTTLETPTASGAGSATASPGSITATATCYTPTATASEEAAYPSSISASSTLYGPAASASGAAQATPASITASITISSPVAMGTGAVEASASHIDASATLNSPTATGSGAAIASPLSIVATSTIYAPSASGGTATASPSPIIATTTIYSPTANGTGEVTASPSSIAASVEINQPAATGAGSAIASSATITATTELYAPTAYGSLVTPDHLVASCRLFRPVAYAVAVNPNPARPGHRASFSIDVASSRASIDSISATHQITKGSAHMAISRNYQLRIGDTSPALECTLIDLPADLDNSSLRLRFRLPGEADEEVRNATSFDVETGLATYQWEAEDFPVETQAGAVSIRWDYETTEDHRGTTSIEQFRLVS